MTWSVSKPLGTVIIIFLAIFVKRRFLFIQSVKKLNRLPTLQVMWESRKKKKNQNRKEIVSSEQILRKNKIKFKKAICFSHFSDKNNCTWRTDTFAQSKCYFWVKLLWQGASYRPIHMPAQKTIALEVCYDGCQNQVV